MADYVTLKFNPEIAGEETVDGHVGEIEIQSFQMGGGRSADVSMLKADDVPSGVAINMTFSKNADKSSALLWGAFLKGTRFDDATVSVLRNTKDGGNVTTFSLKLTKVIIDSFSYATSHGDPSRGSASFSLVASKIEGEADKISFSWDFLTNTP